MTMVGMSMVATSRAWLRRMTAAREIYAALGFRAIAPYYESPIPGTAFLELDLTGPSGETS